MARLLHLPTASPGQARSIVKLQLDRLSPLPASETVFDLVKLKSEPAETLWALGVARRSDLAAARFRDRRTITAAKTVDGVEVLFRFRNADAVDDREQRWLGQAPRLVVLALTLTALALAANLRAGEWRERRLEEIAAEARADTRDARARTEQAAARQAWAGLERADASTRWLCVNERVRSATPEGVAATAVTADRAQVVLQLPDATQITRLTAAGGQTAQPAGAASARPSVAFNGRVCG
jgi:hypothetical protein